MFFWTAARPDDPEAAPVGGGDLAGPTRKRETALLAWSGGGEGQPTTGQVNRRREPGGGGRPRPTPEATGHFRCGGDQGLDLGPAAQRARGQTRLGTPLIGLGVGRKLASFWAGALPARTGHGHRILAVWKAGGGATSDSTRALPARPDRAAWFGIAAPNSPAHHGGKEPGDGPGRAMGVRVAMGRSEGSGGRWGARRTAEPRPSIAGWDGCAYGHLHHPAPHPGVLQGVVVVLPTVKRRRALLANHRRDFLTTDRSGSSRSRKSASRSPRASRSHSVDGADCGCSPECETEPIDGTSAAGPVSAVRGYVRGATRRPGSELTPLGFLRHRWSADRAAEAGAGGIVRGTLVVGGGNAGR